MRNTKLKKKKKSMMSSRFCPRVSSGNSLVWSLTFTSLMCFWWTWCAAWESGLKFYIWISSLLSAAHWGNSPKPPSVLSISPKTTDSGRTVYLRDLPLVSFSCTPLLQLWSFSRYVGYTRKDFFSHYLEWGWEAETALNLQIAFVKMNTST